MRSYSEDQEKFPVKQEQSPVDEEPVSELVYKLDGLGPVDNRPSIDKLHHFVNK